MKAVTHDTCAWYVLKQVYIYIYILIYIRTSSVTWCFCMSWHFSRWYRMFWTRWRSMLIACWGIMVRPFFLFCSGFCSPQMFIWYAWYDPWQAPTWHHVFPSELWLSWICPWILFLSTCRDKQITSVHSFLMLSIQQFWSVNEPVLWTLWSTNSTCNTSVGGREIGGFSSIRFGSYLWTMEYMGMQKYLCTL